MPSTQRVNAAWGSAVPKVAPVAIDDIRAARRRIRDSVLRTPLIPWGGPPGKAPVFLKLENLQPTGSFKVRGAGNSIELAVERARAAGVFTTSNGNMAQALAWHARRLGVPCTAVVSDSAPQVKLEGIRRYGAEIISLPWNEIWAIIAEGRYRPLSHLQYIHPFNSLPMIAGNGTAALEVLEELPDVRKVFVPFGGGGLACGVASALRDLSPHVEVIACESDTAAPFTESLKAGSPSEIERTPSFVDAIGNRSVVPEMWARLAGLVRISRTVSLARAADCIRRAFHSHHIVVEGAGAVPIAAALDEPGSDGPVVAIVSGGNIDPSRFGAILAGGLPGP